MNHKSDGEKKKVTQNFKSLVINIMTAHDHLYTVERTILFDTILGRVCDVPPYYQLVLHIGLRTI